MKEENKLALIVAYYLSKFDQTAYKNLGYKTQSEAHKTISNILGVNINTLKNMRDEFDPYHSNRRKGWHQREILGSRKDVMQKFQNYGEIELREKVQDILRSKALSKFIFSDQEKKEIPESEKTAIEGELIERKVLSYKRNATSAATCKKRDSYTCQSCNFWHENEVVECHHLKPLSMVKETIIKIDNLITLCPTCHRLAHRLLKKDPAKYTDKTTLLLALKALKRSRALN